MWVLILLFFCWFAVKWCSVKLVGLVLLRWFLYGNRMPMIFHRCSLRMQHSVSFLIRSIWVINMNRHWKKWGKPLNAWFVRICVEPDYKWNITHGVVSISIKVGVEPIFLDLLFYCSDIDDILINFSIFCYHNIIFLPQLWTDFTAIFSISSCKSTWDTFYHARKERLLLIAITDPDCPRLPLHEAITVCRICQKIIEKIAYEN